jgi:hypothetical protein
VELRAQLVKQQTTQRANQAAAFFLWSAVASEARQGIRISDCGFRISEFGFRIADFGIRISDCGIWNLEIWNLEL